MSRLFSFALFIVFSSTRVSHIHGNPDQVIVPLCLLTSLQSGPPLINSFAFSDRISDSSLMFLYTFWEGQLNPLENRTADVTGQNPVGVLELLTNPGAVSWIQGKSGISLAGVGSSIPVVSSLTVDRIIRSLIVTNEFSFEMWMTISSMSSLSVVAGFAGYDSRSSFYAECGVDPVCLYIYQSNSNLIASVLGNDVYGNIECTINQEMVPLLAHVVITATWSKESAVVSVAEFVNGQSFEENQEVSPAFSATWDTGYRLMFGMSADAINSFFGWRGNVYLVAMYNRSLTSAEIQVNFNAGLPDNFPVAMPSVQECDAIQDVTSPLNLSMQVSDADDHLTSLYISSVPPTNAGSLLLHNLVLDCVLPITELMIPFLLPQNLTQYSFSFLNSALSAIQLADASAFASISSYTFFQWYANDTFYAGPVATVFINLILSPQASNRTIVLNAGTAQLIQLNDSLNSSTFVAIITLKPTYGVLYQTDDGLQRAAVISSVPQQVTNVNRFVLYESNLPTPSTANSGSFVVSTDSFGYFVRLYNRSSRPAWVQLRLINPYSVIVPANINVSYGQYNFLPLQFSADADEYVLQYQIVSLPALGQLSLSYNTNTLLSVASRFYGNVTHLFYRPFEGDRIAAGDSFSLIIAASQFSSPPVQYHLSILSGRYAQNQLVLFSFQEGQLNHDAVAAVDSASRLMGTLFLPAVSSQWLFNRAGVLITGDNPASKSPGIQTSGTVELVLESLYVTGNVSFEVWISLSTASLYGMIVGLGTWSPSSASVSCIGGFNSDTPSGGRRNLQFYQWGNNQIVTTFSDENGACQSISSFFNNSLRMHHLVITITTNVSSPAVPARVSVYVDGILSEQTQLIVVHFSKWNTSNHLEVSSEAMTTDESEIYPFTWQGEMFLLSIYSCELTPSQVEGNYVEGVPNSLPVLTASDRTFYITQDPGVTVLTNLSLSATDYDGDALSLFILILPQDGMLYVCIEGLYSPILTSFLPYEITLPTTTQLGYEPFNRVFSQDNFTVRAYDGVDFGAATIITVAIRRTFLLPVPVSASITTVGGQPVTIQLNGLDEDPAEALVSVTSSAIILSLPALGNLYQFQENNTRGTIIDIAPTVLFDLSNRLVYLNSKTLAIGVLSFNDSFTFTVSCMGMTSVALGQVVINVANPLSVNSIVLGLSVASMSFSLSGQSVELLSSHNVTFLLLSLPSKGNVSIAGSIISLTELLETEIQGISFFTSQSLVYATWVSLSDNQYHNAPNLTWDSFLFSAMDGFGNYAAEAGTVTITFPPVHHAPSLTCSSGFRMNTSNVAYQWTGVSISLIDSDASNPLSLFSLENPYFLYSYGVTVSSSPLSGLLLRLSPGRQTDLSVISGASPNGGIALSFSGTYSEVQESLCSDIEICAIAIGDYFVNAAITQQDTQIVVKCSTIVSSISATSNSTANPESNTSSFFSIRLNGWETWVLVGVGIIMCGCIYAKYRLWFCRSKKEKITVIEKDEEKEGSKTQMNSSLALASAKATNLSPRDTETTRLGMRGLPPGSSNSTSTHVFTPEIFLTEDRNELAPPTSQIIYKDTPPTILHSYQLQKPKGRYLYLSTPISESLRLQSSKVPASGSFSLEDPSMYSTREELLRLRAEELVTLEQVGAHKRTSAYSTQPLERGAILSRTFHSSGEERLPQYSIREGTSVLYQSRPTLLSFTTMEPLDQKFSVVHGSIKGSTNDNEIVELTTIEAVRAAIASGHQVQVIDS